MAPWSEQFQNSRTILLQFEPLLATLAMNSPTRSSDGHQCKNRSWAKKNRVFRCFAGTRLTHTCEFESPFFIYKSRQQLMSLIYISIAAVDGSFLPRWYFSVSFVCDFKLILAVGLDIIRAVTDIHLYRYRPITAISSFWKLIIYHAKVKWIKWTAHSSHTQPKNHNIRLKSMQQKQDWSLSDAHAKWSARVSFVRFSFAWNRNGNRKTQNGNSR